ncbi:MAG: cohesin domain-containing protein, partial [Candidatus Neomarinimicrobiota bacterium]
DGAIHAYDAALILKYLVGDTVLTEGHQWNADVTLDNTISAGDAGLILQYVAGIIDTLPTVPDASFIAQGSIEIPDMELHRGDSFSLPVGLNGSSNIIGFQMKIEFDPEAIQFTSVQWTTPPSTSIIITHEDNGSIYIAGASATLLSDGNWLSLMLTVDSVSTENETSVTIRNLRWNEGQFIDSVTTAKLSLKLATEPSTPASPKEFALMQNFPNPFNATTSIRYYLPHASALQLTIYDVSGRLQKTLLDGYQSAGYHEIIWEAPELGSGVYIYRIIAGEFRDARKCVLLK